MSNHDPKQIQCYVKTSLFGTLRENLQKILERIFTYLQNLQDQIDAIVPTPGGASNVGKHPDDIPTAPNPEDDEFEVDGTIDTAGTREPGAVPWSWFNQGDATAVIGQGHLLLTDPTNTTLDLHVIRQPAPTAPWVYRFKFSDLAALSANYAVGGLCVMDTTGKLLVLSKDFNALWSWSLDRYSNVNTFTTTIGGQNILDEMTYRIPWYYEVENDGTNIIYRWSASGVEGTYTLLGSDPIASFLTTADYIGIIVGSVNANSVSVASQWFRRIS